MKIPLEKQLEEVYQIFNKDHARLRRQLLDSVSEPKAEFRQIEPPQRSGSSFGGRIIMSRAIKIAAGIILIGIIAVGIRHFTGSKISTSVAFGQVLRQIQNSSYTFDLTTVAEGEASPAAKGMVLRTGRLRIDAPQVMGGVSTIADISTKKYLLLFHGQKTAMTEIPGAENVPDGAGPFTLFTNPVENLWNLRDGTEKSLGEKEIDGQPAVGFQVQQDEQEYHCEIVVWAHAETGSPIRVEITISNPDDSSQSMTMVMSQFRLDVELDEELFSLEPPPGYTLAYQKTLQETLTPTESTPQAQKIEQSIALWSRGKEDEAVETLLSADWTKPIEFSDRMYLFSLTEKGYVALKPQD
ncbi:MAG: outer membrane lipoprotein carrier protein LolA, partial [Sedimentisphaerales bacterium]